MCFVDAQLFSLMFKCFGLFFIDPSLFLIPCPRMTALMGLWGGLPAFPGLARTIRRPVAGH